MNRECTHHMKGPVDTPTEPSCSHDLHTGASIHDGLIVQRVADGGIGHQWKEGELYASEKNNKENL